MFIPKSWCDMASSLQDGQSALITPLLHASLHGHVQCVKALLDRGAQTNLQDKVSAVPMSVADMFPCSGLCV